MRQPLRRRNGHSFEPDTALAPQPRWLSSLWMGKLNNSYHQATSWVTEWITLRIRTWESQTSVSQRRRQVLLFFGVIGLFWLIRLLYLFYQLPPLSALVPAVGQLATETNVSQSKSRRGSSSDSTHKADYLEARSGVTRSGRSAGAVTRRGPDQLPQQNKN
ncbi:MAG: hypothetical protein EOO39_14455 [Cytophagaceae bacterium]|nr:MAG: hypothetical protein EOO39_14455 [Cytophagaceae bacterium]